jgi:hypothetical protein
MGCRFSCFGNNKMNSESHRKYLLKKYFENSELSPKDNIVSLQDKNIDVIEGMYCGTKQKFKGIKINPNLKKIDITTWQIIKLDTLAYKNYTGCEYLEIEHLELKDEKPDNDHKNNLQYAKERIKLCKSGLDSESIDKILSKNKIIKTFSTNLHGIFGLFFLAYSYHKNVLVRPDDIWFHILEQLQIIINDYPEQMRKYFVEHEGKEIIAIEIEDESMFNGSNIEKFILQFNKIIETKVKSNFIQTVNQNFSTTTAFDKTLYNITAMVSMKKYFDYNIEVSCGIKKIYLGGELEDWEKILLELHNLKTNFGPYFKKYISKVIPIINEFVNAYKGSPNIGFFNRVIRQDAQMAGEMIKDGYTIGGINFEPIRKYVDGWIKDLYWFDSDSDVLPTHFEKRELSCDVTISNNGIKTIKQIVTTNTVGIAYYDSLDSVGMIKGWWIKNK